MIVFKHVLSREPLFLLHIWILYVCVQFGIRSAVLNAELPQNSRLHILEVCCGNILCMFLLTIKSSFDMINFHTRKIYKNYFQEFNVGLFDYLIASDESQPKENTDAKPEMGTDTKKSRKHAKAKLDSEFGVVRGIDFKNVHTVC